MIALKSDLLKGLITIVNLMKNIFKKFYFIKYLHL